jgi:hypothetical protein
MKSEGDNDPTDRLVAIVGNRRRLTARNSIGRHPLTPRFRVGLPTGGAWRRAQFNHHAQLFPLFRVTAADTRRAECQACRWEAPTNAEPR